MCRFRLLLALLATLLSFAVADCARAEETSAFALEGRVRFFMCPEGDYRLPAEGHPGWTELRLSPDGIEGTLPYTRGIAWLTLDVHIPCDWDLSHSHSLLIPNPPEAEEIYLNGVFLGGLGQVGPPYVQGPSGPHVVTFAPGLLRCGPNQLQIKALIAEEDLALFQGPLRLGQTDRIRSLSEELKETDIALEAAVLSATLLLVLFYSMLVVSGVTRVENFLVAALLGGHFLLFFLDSNLLHRLDLAGSWVPQVQNPLSVIVGFIMLTLVTDLTGYPRHFLYWTFAAASGIFVLLYLLISPVSALYLLSGPKAFLYTLRGIAYVYMSLNAVYRRQPEATAILAGVTAYVLGTRLDVLFGTDWGVYSLLFFSISLLFVLTRRHARLKERLLAISARLVDAQEEERLRLAREVHDGLGQSVLALKLKLQILLNRSNQGNAPSREDLEGLVSDTSSVAEEIRHTAHNLRPVFFATKGLEEAILWHVENYGDRLPFEVFVHPGKEPLKKVPDRVKDHLYRIFQEILTNAAKHSGATRLDTTLYMEGRTLVLAATDNGKGFDVTQTSEKGIGLSTMQERAHILGGELYVESHAGRGTTVRVEVPLK